MKIKKFSVELGWVLLNEKLESTNYYLFTKHESDGFDVYNHLFDSYNTLFDYMICEIYYQLKNQPKLLNDFDAQDFDGDIDEVFDYYNKLRDKYRLDELSYEDIKIEKDVKFKDWMKLRMNSKKYNI